jgi:hypothetical protein
MFGKMQQWHRINQAEAGSSPLARGGANMGRTLRLHTAFITCKKICLVALHVLHSSHAKKARVLSP